VKKAKTEKRVSVADSVFDQMLARIQDGEWSVGFTIPSERDLIEEFGVSRIALREAILKLRTLGVLKVSQGKRSVVAKMDSRILGRLFPLIMAMEGEQTFHHIFQVRLLLEKEAVRLAALHRTDRNLAVLDALLEDMADIPTTDPDGWGHKDLAIHLEIARATQNPLFEPMLETLSGYLAHIQTIGIDGFPERQRIAHAAHHALVDAIRRQEPDRARAEMETHLWSGADHIISYHLWNDVRAEGSPGKEGFDQGASVHEQRYGLGGRVVGAHLRRNSHE